MHVVFVSAEAAPYAKVGGLADVAGSLPQALAAQGHQVTLYLPLHGTIDRAKWGIPARGPSRSVPFGPRNARTAYPSIERDGVRVVFVDNARLLARDRVYGAPDDDKRYAFFCRAVLEDIRGARPDIVHAHDWHAALLIPLAARTMRRTATVFTIHNLAYQGRTSADILKLIGLPRARLVIEDPGEANPMARAIATADIVSTVSQQYAKEILTPAFGERLDKLLRSRRRRLAGIVNGIDTKTFDPATDQSIVARYSASDLSGKTSDKSALQREGGLAANALGPLFGVVGRLVEQKGVDLLTAVAPRILDAGGQIVVLGTGDPAYETKWQVLAKQWAGRLWLTLGFDAALAQRVYAGSDLFLMPSRFEPCGLGQLISFRYGTLPVVHAVGGLAETVRDVDADAATGNGFSFTTYSADAFAATIDRATKRYRAGGAAWHALIERVMREDHSWDASARRYVDLYARAIRLRRAA
ncbi:MAG TPA: glycogen/starch synthase [Candidatus Limnocylindria bacterium]|nr:glycogen/starch synthase [Candidatus Limnocylindria bacterium]